MQSRSGLHEACAALLAGVMIAACSGRELSTEPTDGAAGGEDGPGTAGFQNGADAAARSLAVSLSASATTSCPGSCVELTPQIDGGTAPYTVRWSDGATSGGGTRQVCPAATTTYTVVVTDSSGKSGELALPDLQAQASVTITIPRGACATPPASRPTLAVGGDHSCALRGGKVECWGSNWGGELGIGVSSGPQSCDMVACSLAPVAVTGSSSPVDAVAAGAGETCALIAGGTVACWGANDLGQLGDGSTSGPELCPGQLPCSTTPGVVAGVTGATAVATNGIEACAVLSSGAVECWGNNLGGEVGSGTVVSGNTVSPVPAMVSGLTLATAVALGSDYACALLRDGTIQCWGSNGSGQLGDGSTTDSTTPVAVSGVTGATAIAAGSGHTCARMADGTVACWGEDDAGELGTASSGSPQTCVSNEPCATTAVKVPDLSGVTAIAAGVHDTCALLSDGTVRCWGWNYDGQLGDGTTTDSSTPVVVSGLSGVSAIAMADASACALVAGGDVVCWGDNGEGQLASATTGPQTCNGDACSTTPRSVSGL